MEISITRALKELKLLDNRIEEAINQIASVGYTRKRDGDKVLNYPTFTTKEFAEKAKAAYASAKDLMERRAKIKSAIVASNANTIVTVANFTFSVAEAIDYKTSIHHKKRLRQLLRTQYSNALRELEQASLQLDANLNKMLEQNLGKDKKVNKEDFDAIAKPLLEANTLQLLNPLKVEEVIEGLGEEIETFEAEIDVVLSESNSRTNITI